MSNIINSPFNNDDDNLGMNLRSDEQKLYDAMEKAKENLKLKKRSSFKFFLLRIWRFLRDYVFIAKEFTIVFLILISPLIVIPYGIAVVASRPRNFAKELKKYEFVLDDIMNRKDGKLITIDDHLAGYLITQRENSKLPIYKDYYAMLRIKGNKIRVYDDEYIALLNKGDDVLEVKSGYGYSNWIDYTDENGQEQSKYDPNSKHKKVAIKDPKSLHFELVYQYNYLDSIQKNRFDNFITKDWVNKNATNGVIKPDKAKVLTTVKINLEELDNVAFMIQKRPLDMSFYYNYDYVKKDTNKYWEKYFAHAYSKNILRRYTKHKLLKMDKYVAPKYNADNYEDMFEQVEVESDYSHLNNIIYPYVERVSFEDKTYKKKMAEVTKIRENNKKYVDDVIKQMKTIGR